MLPSQLEDALLAVGLEGLRRIRANCFQIHCSTAAWATLENGCVSWPGGSNSSSTGCDLVTLIVLQLGASLIVHLHRLEPVRSSGHEAVHPVLEDLPILLESLLD